MRRYPLLGILALTLACAGRPVANAPAPAGSDEPLAVVPADDASSGPAAAGDAAPGEHPSAPVVAGRPGLDDRDLTEEARLAADSAADAEVLDAMAEAGVADDEEGSVGGASALGGAEVTWDIDVESFASHDRVQYWLEFFQDKARPRMGVWLGRLPLYEDMIRAELKARELPTDLVYLALIESGFSNSAISTASAVGMWQFMRGTARDYGLRVDGWVDERRDPFKATRAAARYLSDLYRRFGSLYLAAAAYNAGGGRISRSLVRLEQDDASLSDTTFFRLYDTQLLHRETRDYVPKLIAAALIAKEPERYGFSVPADVGPLEYDSLVVKGMVGLDVVARLADTTVAAVRELNRQYLRLTTPPSGTWVIRLPEGKGERTREAFAKLPARERISYYTHVVRKGETLSGIAAKYHVSQALIREANPRIRGSLIRIGQRVIVPTGARGSAAVARRLAESEDAAPVRSRRVWHTVRRGESLSVIARRYEVSQRDLQRWNGMGRSTKLIAGRRIRIAPPSGSAPAKASSRVASARTHTVRRGETLTGLAKRYGVTLTALKAANRRTLGRRSELRIGEKLRIPG